jgi:hypothetical protein
MKDRAAVALLFLQLVAIAVPLLLIGRAALDVFASAGSPPAPLEGRVISMQARWDMELEAQVYSCTPGFCVVRWEHRFVDLPSEGGGMSCERGVCSAIGRGPLAVDSLR